jgi:hypothetical protein
MKKHRIFGGIIMAVTSLAVATGIFATEISEGYCSAPASALVGEVATLLPKDTTDTDGPNSWTWD